MSTNFPTSHSSSSRWAPTRHPWHALRHFAAALADDGTVLDVNDVGLPPLPFRRHDYMGQRLWETAPWRANRAAAQRLAELVARAATGAEAHATVTLVHQEEAGLAIDLTFEVWATGTTDDGGRRIVVVEAHDVSAKAEAETALARRTRDLAEADARFAALAQSTSDLVCLHTPSGEYDYVSPSVRRLLGYEPDELLNRRPDELVHPDDREQVRRRYQIHSSPGVGPSEFQYRIRRRGGAYTWFETILTSIVDASDKVTQMQSSSRDITERKRTEQELVRLAFHDELTGLPNRALLLDRIGQALAVARRTGYPVGVLFIDLDGFKLVNDTIGHYAGDATLVAVSERLTGLVRPGDTLARITGDEFVMLCPGVDADGAATVARRILRAIGQPFTVYGRPVELTASIGIALSGGGDDAVQLIENADAAMYESKRAGRNRFSIYDPSTRSAQVSRLATEIALRHAIEGGELRLHYQPEIDLATGEVDGYEALVRWDRDGTLVGPSEFIPLAEETGLIVPLGDWVIREACRQIDRWSTAGMANLRVWVNVSARQLGQPDLVEKIKAALREHRVRPESLCIEITESALMEDAEAATAQLDQLRSLGIHLGVDDFGTGYSSLAYLNRFPLDVLKIDQSFVARLTQDSEASTIVAAIIDLAHALDLKVIAEGVENPDQLAVLRVLGCDQAVGFLFSEPVPADAVRAGLGHGD